MKPTSASRNAFVRVCAAGASLAMAGYAFVAQPAAGKIDRTVLPIAEPKRPFY